MTLRVSDLQSDSDLDSIRNFCDVFFKMLNPIRYATQCAEFLIRAQFYKNMGAEVKFKLLSLSY